MQDALCMYTANMRIVERLFSDNVHVRDETIVIFFVKMSLRILKLFSKTIILRCDRLRYMVYQT